MFASLTALVVAYFVYVSAIAQKKGSLQQKLGIALTVLLVVAAAVAAYYCVEGCVSGKCWMMLKK